MEGEVDGDNDGDAWKHENINQQTRGETLLFDFRPTTLEYVTRIPGRCHHYHVNIRHKY